jgi:hypothetical protein
MSNVRASGQGDMTRWSHGHSIGAGVLIGVLASGHIWLIAATGVVAGWLARDLYSIARWTAQAIAHKRAKRPGTRYARFPKGY